jgi:hypothetical protein
MVYRILVFAALLLPVTAHAATFERVQDALIGWHYTYEASSNGYQVPIYFALRQCSKGPTIVMAQGYSPVDHCFADEGAARLAAQKWADSEELRYRDVQDPSPAPIKAVKKLWKKVTGQ